MTEPAVFTMPDTLEEAEAAWDLAASDVRTLQLRLSGMTAQRWMSGGRISDPAYWSTRGQIEADLLRRLAHQRALKRQVARLSERLSAPGRRASIEAVHALVRAYRAGQPTGELLVALNDLWALPLEQQP